MWCVTGCGSFISSHSPHCTFGPPFRFKTLVINNKTNGSSKPQKLFFRRGNSLENPSPFFFCFSNNYVSCQAEITNIQRYLYLKSCSSWEGSYRLLRVVCTGFQQCVVKGWLFNSTHSILNKGLLSFYILVLSKFIASISDRADIQQRRTLMFEQ